MNRKPGSGGLDPEDRALWDEITKSVAPLRATPAKPAAPAVSPRKPATKYSAPRPPAPPKPPPLAKLDRRARQRIVRGTAAIDGRLDLHGLTLDRARSRLQSYLAEAQSRGAAVVLVITGKGATGGAVLGRGERGVLRRQVPLWLALPEFRPLVIGFEEAAQAHGGAGALYVRVRRRRG